MPVCAFVDACVAQRLERVRDVLGFGELDGLVVKIGDYGRSVVLLDCVDYLRSFIWFLIISALIDGFWSSCGFLPPPWFSEKNSGLMIFPISW